jgi:hypothetical protein
VDTVGRRLGRWLPLAPDHQSCDVADQSAEPTCSLALYRRLIALRDVPRCRSATTDSPAPPVPMATCWPNIREAEGSRLLVVLNLGAIPQRSDPAGLAVRGPRSALDPPHRAEELVDGPFELRGDEGIVAQLE